MNNNILQAFARNGLQILQWCMLILLYEAEGEKLTHDEIRHQLKLPESNKKPPGGANKNALVREILRSSREIYGHVEYLGRATWRLTPTGRAFVEEHRPFEYE